MEWFCDRGGLKGKTLGLGWGTLEAHRNVLKPRSSRVKEACLMPG